MPSHVHHVTAILKFLRIFRILCQFSPLGPSWHLIFTSLKCVCALEFGGWCPCNRLLPVVGEQTPPPPQKKQYLSVLTLSFLSELTWLLVVFILRDDSSTFVCVACTTLILSCLTPFTYLPCWLIALNIANMFYITFPEMLCLNMQMWQLSN